MDLKDLTPKSDDIVVTIKHPSSGEPLLNEDKSEMTITIFAPHTKEYKKVIHEQTNKRLKEMQSGGGNRKEVTAEEIEEATLEILAKTTKSWSITFDGKMPKLTLDKAKAIYEEVFWIKAQIEGAVEDSLDFMKV